MSDDVDFYVRDSDEAFVICVWETQTVHISHSINRNIWASTKPDGGGGNERLRQAFEEAQRAIPQRRILLVITSFQPRPHKRPLYGIAEMIGPPDFNLRSEAEWERPESWGDPFPIRWLIIAGSTLETAAKASDILSAMRDATRIEHHSYLYAAVVECLLHKDRREPNDTQREQMLNDALIKRRLREESSAPDGESKRPRTMPKEKGTGDAPMFDLFSMAPKPPAHDPRTDLTFCVLDIDSDETNSIHDAPFELDLLFSKRAPRFRLFGVTVDGASVTAMVHGFLPFFYCNAPPDILKSMDYDRARFTPQYLDAHPEFAERIAHESKQLRMCELFRFGLNEALKSELNAYEKQYPPKSLVVRVDLVWRQTADGYYPTKAWFFKVTTCSAKLVTRARQILTDGFKCHENAASFKHTVYEANVAFVLRYMIEIGLFGMSWVTIPAGKYQVVPDVRESHSDIEIRTHWKSVVAHRPDEEKYQDIPPVRVLTFDCEMAGLNGRFPVAFETSEGGVTIPGSGDPVIAIGCRVSKEGLLKPGESRIVGDVIFTWGRCAATSTANMLCFYSKRKGATDGSCEYFRTLENERDMLEQFHQFITHVARPHVLVGFNHEGFDLPYLLARAKHLKLMEFANLGWMRHDATFVKTKKFSSKQIGTFDRMEFHVSGRLTLDVMAVVKRDFKMRSYTLNAVAEELVKERKADVAPSQITPLWNGSDEDRKRVCEYCIQDVNVTDKIAQKLGAFVDKTELARVTGVPFGFILSRGQQIRTTSLLLREARKNGYIIPTRTDRDDSEESVNLDEEKYKGATVLEPKCGFYQEPVATLDFSSLYPSIMIRQNLCHTTHLTPQQAQQMSPADYYEILIDNGEMVYFVREHVKRGLLPVILVDLTEARNKAKKLKSDAEKAKEVQKAKNFDMRQNAIKTSSNSVYGFCGAEKTGQFPCKDVARAVTATGRVGIELTADAVEHPYTVVIPRDVNEIDEHYVTRCRRIRDSYPIVRSDGESEADHARRIALTVKIIYGDTDSVMVHMMKLYNSKDAIDLGLQFSHWISENLFKRPMRILFEKIYFPYLLLTRKRYAGCLYEKPDEIKKLDMKGLESVRRDNCRMASGMVTAMIGVLLKERSMQKVIEMVLERVEAVRNDRVDVADLIVSKSLSKAPESYSPPTPASQVAIKILERGDADIPAPRVGDRVPYIVTAYVGKGQKVSKFAEHPFYAMKMGIPYSKLYYVENQLRKPVERILEPLLPGVTNLIFGRTNCTIYLPKDLRAPTNSSSPDVPPPPPPAPPRKARPKIVAGQKTLSGELIPLPPPKRAPSKPSSAQLKAAAKKAPSPGQMSLNGTLLVKPQRLLTEAREGAIPVQITHMFEASETSSAASSMISSHCQRFARCVGCKGVIVSYETDRETPTRYEEDSENVPALCDSCERNGVTLNLPAELHTATTLCKEYWKTCVECQKVDTVDDLAKCYTFDCYNVYRRVSIRSRVQKLQKDVLRLDRHLAKMSLTEK